MYSMHDSSQSQLQFTTELLDHESLFPNDQPIINFTSHQIPHKKTRICAWNQHLYDDDNHKSIDFHISPSLQHQKQRIQHFLATIRIKNGSFSRIPKTNKKTKGIDNPEGQKSDSYIPLNSTLITFPKSRSQCRKLENEQKLILQKLYRKRQKSKVIPKQISINPITAHQTLKPVYPSKNYLSKNRNFIEEHQSKNLNPEYKTIKEISGLKRKYPSSYYKKVSGVFQINLKSEKLIDFDKKRNSFDRNLLSFKEFAKKNNSLNDENADFSSPTKLYSTIYSSPRFNKMIFRHQNEFSVQKIKENAKNSHLNRKKFFELNGKNQMQLLGSTITQWKMRAEQKLQKSDLIKT